MRRTQPLSTDWRGPNGIALAPDERYLYKAARGHLRMALRALDIGALESQSCDRGNEVSGSLGWHI